LSQIGVNFGQIYNLKIWKEGLSEISAKRCKESKVNQMEATIQIPLKKI
jgi:hypothetical protein